MNKFKRMLALFMVVCMIIGLVPIQTSAATLGTKPNDGTVSVEYGPFDEKVSANHRIPGLVALEDGTLVATADARWDSEKDGGGMDVVVSTLKPGESVWNYTYAAYLGDNGNEYNANSSTLMDPLVITDGTNLYLLADLFPAGYSLSTGNTSNAFSMTGTGFDEKGRMVLGKDGQYSYYLENGQIYTASTDSAQVVEGYTVDGWFNLYQDETYVSNLFFADSPYMAYPTSYISMQTYDLENNQWSEPELLNVKESGCTWNVLGPGSGIVTSDGDIAFTTYNGSSISLVHGTSGDWNVVKATAANNESSIVELSDGTIRAFVKNGNNKITYVDFTKNEEGTYIAGSAVNTGVDNCGSCMISSMKYSKLINGQEAIFVCCPTSAGIRSNGKIHVFLLDENNDMSLLTSYQINEAFFAYSDMAEINDGNTIALLYEDGCLSYNAAPAIERVDHSHITYTQIDVNKIVPNAQIGTEGFYISAGAKAERVMEISFATGETSAKTLTFEGLLATQKLEVTSYDENVVNVVVEGSNITITPIAAGATTIVFTVKDDVTKALATGTTYELPVSVYGVTSAENVSLTVGQTAIFTDESGNYSGTDVSALNGIATVQITGTTELYNAQRASGTLDNAYSGAKVQLEDCLYTFKKNDDATYVISANEGAVYLRPYGTAGYPNTTSPVNVTVEKNDNGFTFYGINPSNTSKSGYLYFYRSSNSRFDQVSSVDATACAFMLYRPAEENETGSTEIPGYVQVNDVEDGKSYLILAEYNSNYYALYPDTTSTFGHYTSVAKVLTADDTVTAGTSEITFTGAAAGSASVIIGKTQYNVTVTGNTEETEREEDIRLYVGFSKTVRIDDAAYNETAVSVAPDTAIATVDKVEAVTTEAETNLETIADSTRFDGSAKFILENTRSQQLLSSESSAHQSANGFKCEAGPASVDYEHLWTFTDKGNGVCTIQYEEKYLTLGALSATLEDAEAEINYEYENGTWKFYVPVGEQQYYLSDIYGSSWDGASTWNEKNDAGNYWNVYQIVETAAETYTNVTFTGVSAGTTTAKIGNTTYNIEVLDLNTGDIASFNNIVGVDSYSDDNSNATYRSDLDMNGKIITLLTISEGATFHLGVDVKEYESIQWTSADETIATVDAQGNVTGVSEGTTNVIATVTQNGVTEAISIPVDVKASLVDAGEEATTLFYYIELTKNTTPYYTMFLNTVSTTEPVYSMVPATEGEVIYLLRPRNSALGWIWTSRPDDNHALVYMSSTGSISQYCPLLAPDGTLGTSGEGGIDYYKGSNGYNNVVNLCSVSADTLNAVLQNAVSESYQCDGAMSNTRRDTDSVPKVVTSMSFASDPLFDITKTINGVLPITRKQADFRRYQDGMVATVGEYIYFQIDITLERPYVMTGEENNLSAVTYTNARLVDDVFGEDAYFYTKELDNADGAWDGVVSSAYQVQEQDITDALNAAWADDEETRTLSYYVIYEIQPEDIQHAHILNTANIGYNYSSAYSSGVFAGEASADAQISVVGLPMNKVVVDFGQTITLSDISDAYLKDVYIGTEAHYTAHYGEVTITKDSANGTYDITYTPTEIMQSLDAVALYGAATENEIARTEKVINGFNIYPATVMHYEEGFMFNNQSSGWDTTNARKATKEQTLEYLGIAQFDTTGTMTGYVSNKIHNYGKEPDYDSKNSYATTSTMGAKTTFEITGTGFEIYANCTGETGCVSVQVKNEEGSTVKFYMVNTAALSGNNSFTSGQEGAAYGTPIVSLRDLPHGRYTISISKIMDTKPVVIDGLRVFNTVEDTSIFSVDSENEPHYVEIRDAMLSALNISKTTESGEIVDQIYAELGTLTGAVVLGTEDALTDEVKQDLLENGTKNEFYLYPGQVLTFTINENLKAQIGMRAPMGSTTYSLNASTNSETVSSSTNMFYEEVMGAVTITNTGDKVLSLTLLKLLGASAGGVAPIFAEIEAANVEAAALSLERLADGSYEDVQEEPKDVTEVFSDIRDGWYVDNVQFVFDKSIMNGIGGTDMFKPNANITKAQVAQILYNMEGRPYVYSKTVFEELGDVSETDWFADAVAWAYGAGIITGNTSTMEFNPDTDITRQQLSVMLYRYSQYKNYNMRNKAGFEGMENADEVSEWAMDGMSWAVGNGIISGVDRNGVKDLAPKGDATRAQVATMMQRFCSGNNL